MDARQTTPPPHPLPHAPPHAVPRATAKTMPEPSPAPAETVPLPCQQSAADILETLLRMLRKRATHGQVMLEDVERIVEIIVQADGPMRPLYARRYQKCRAAFEAAAQDRQRTDFLGRLVTSTFAPLLSPPDPVLEREQVPQLFTAIRMILGDETFVELQTGCSCLVAQYRGNDSLVDWPAYYADPEARLILERVLVSVARSFRRFTPRKDWFLIVMNSSPTSVSLSSNAFIPKAPNPAPNAGHEGRHFTERHFLRLFTALFADQRPETFDRDRRAGFSARWGCDPDQVFGPLFVDLAQLRQRVDGRPAAAAASRPAGAARGRS